MGADTGNSERLPLRVPSAFLVEAYGAHSGIAPEWQTASLCVLLYCDKNRLPYTLPLPLGSRRHAA